MTFFKQKSSTFHSIFPLSDLLDHFVSLLQIICIPSFIDKLEEMSVQGSCKSIKSIDDLLKLPENRECADSTALSE